MNRWLTYAVGTAILFGSAPAAAEGATSECIAVLDAAAVLRHAPSAATLKAKLLARGKDGPALNLTTDPELMAVVVELQQAAESVRRQHGFTLIVDRDRAGVRGEDVTSEVQQRLKEPLPPRTPLPFAMTNRSARQTPCAAVVNMKAALDKVRHAYNAEHVLEADSDPMRQEIVLAQLLEIQRHELKEELHVLHLIDVTTVFAVSPEIRDETSLLMRSFMLRFGRVTRAALTAAAEPHAAESLSCTKLTESLCLPGDHDIHACEAAIMLGNRTAALCEAASAKSSAPAAPRVERTRRPLATGPCESLRQHACSGGRASSDDCKQVMAALPNMSAGGCAFTLKQRQAKPAPETGRNE